MKNEEYRAVFRQSLKDFPCPVAVDKNTPSFGLYRFKKGLRFIPSDDEGFTVRGDKKRLVYRGRKRSHRFTILGDTAFEYDCILNKEPDTNIVTLMMEGTGHFDFFRQPDFIKNPLLAGSYAVYKKETVIGEGTGKLCHIHRPEIIDARGRQCWGDLSVAGSELRITIPEQWLGEAIYPVIVDPTIGTATVGSQNKWMEDGETIPIPLCFELSVPVNRFLVSEAINGACTAYVYSNEDDGDAGGRPVLYSDNGNKPQARKSAQESPLDLRVNGSKPPGWRTATFMSNGAISSGSYIWFGVFTEYIWFPRFDYGAKCYADWWDSYDSIPNAYPLGNENWFEDFKLSMYFNYTGIQNYVRTLAQGVTLIDTMKAAGYYRRPIPETAFITTLLTKFYKMKRLIAEALPVLNITRRWGNFTGLIKAWAENTAETVRKGTYYRKQQDSTEPIETVLRGLLFTFRVVTTSFVRDYIIRRFLKAKTELELKSCICREIILESKIN